MTDNAPSTSDRLLTLSQVCDLIGRSRASIYRDIAAETFPKPVKAGKSSRWRLSEIQAYIAHLPRAA